MLLEGLPRTRRVNSRSDAERRLAPLTMSCGAAELQHQGERPADLFRAADAAQYVAKRAGRGRVYVAQPGALEATPARTLRQAAGVSLAARTLAVLEDDLAGRPVADRMEAVTVAFADAFDASGWAISVLEPGSTIVRTVFEGGRRAEHVSGVPSLRFSGSGDDYELAEYPDTAAVMARGGTFMQWIGDPASDPAELELLERAGHLGMLGAAIVHDGQRLAGGALLRRPHGRRRGLRGASCGCCMAEAARAGR